MDSGAIMGIAAIVLTAGVGTWVRIVITKINGSPTAKDFDELKLVVKDAINEGSGGRRELWKELNAFRQDFAQFKGKMEAKINGR